MEKCFECQEEYEAMPNGLCEDCQSDFDSLDLEDRLFRAMSYGIGGLKINRKQT